MEMIEWNQSAYLLQTANKSLGLTDKIFLLNVPKMPKIKDICTTKDYEVMLGVIFTDASALAGITTKLDAVTVADLKRLVETKYKSLSIFEIYKAFENDRYGVNDKITPHFNYCNAAYVSQVIDKYVHWKREKMTDYNISLGTPEQTLLLPPADERIMMIEAVNNAYTSYCESGYYDGVVVHLFDFLVSEGIIITNTEGVENEKYARYFAAKYHKAKEMLENEASGSNSDRGQMRKAREVLRHIRETNKTDKLNAMVMRLVILDIFEKRKKEKVTKIL